MGFTATEYRWLVLATVIIQLALVSVTFPVTQLTTQTPLFYIDSPFHWYEIEVAKGLAATGHIVGYDPYFAAGNVGGVGFNASVKFPAFLAIVLSRWLSTIVVYKLFAFAAALIAPACIPVAARWLRLSRGVTLATTIFALLLWWVSALRWFETAGMASFVAAAYLAMPYAAFVLRYLTEPMQRSALLGLGAVGAAGMFLHPLFGLLVGPLVLAFTFAYWRDVDVRRLVETFVVLPILCVGPNFLWIWPMLKYPSYANGDISPYQKAVDLSIVWNEMLGRITGDARGSRLNIVLWFTVLWAFATPLAPAAKRFVIALTAVSVALILFAAVGAALPFVGTLQPNRFSSVAYLDLCFPAGFGAVAIFVGLGPRGTQRGVAAASVAVMVLAAGFFARELAREVSYADVPHHGERPPEIRAIGDESAWVLSWLAKNTTPEARVLFETSKGRIHDDAHMAGFYALTSDREFVGGPYPFMFFTGFWDGYLFGRDIDSLSPQEFSDYLSLYNIGSIIAFSDESVRYFDQVPGLIRGERFGPIRTYIVPGPHSFFLAGSGSVSARSFNRIELSQLSGRSVVLKYHYAPGLEAIPRAQLEPVQISGDPTPFIRIIDPPPHLVLQMGQ